MSTIRVLLADDHEVVREGLRATLSFDPEITITGEAADGGSAVDAARALRPDIIVMDVTMPRMNGLQATQILEICCPETAVVILTRHGDEAFSRKRALPSSCIGRSVYAADYRIAIRISDRRVASGERDKDGLREAQARLFETK